MSAMRDFNSYAGYQPCVESCEVVAHVHASGDAPSFGSRSIGHSFPSTSVTCDVCELANLGVLTFSATMRHCGGEINMASLASVCSICGNSVLLQDSKADEHGMAVHATCYAAKISSAGDGALRPWRQIARELAAESNNERIYELQLELNEAMAAQRMQGDNDFSGNRKEINGRAPHGDPKP